MYYDINVPFAGEIFYWDLVEAETVGHFKAHAGVVTSMSIHADGELLLTSSIDGCVKVWAK